MATSSGEQGFEDISLSGEVEGFTKQRVELVQRATGQWIRALRDLTARNNLLCYRDLKWRRSNSTAAASLSLWAVRRGIRRVKRGQEAPT